MKPFTLAFLLFKGLRKTPTENISPREHLLTKQFRKVKDCIFKNYDDLLNMLINS